MAVLACALPASAGAASNPRHFVVPARAVAITLKQHPRMKAHRIMPVALKQHPRMK
jgi:hypothetical protein